ncbi:MAG: hypothetical protein JRG91_15960, partial [Deltaproteobacteria bacterium]|nr:hypothetical protein [Deltaproteobacteria bacterium]
LYLLDSSGGVLTESISTSDNESLSWTFGEGSLAHIRVALDSDGGENPGNAYNLSL